MLGSIDANSVSRSKARTVGCLPSRLRSFANEAGRDWSFASYDLATRAKALAPHYHPKFTSKHAIQARIGKAILPPREVGQSCPPRQSA